MEYVGNINSWTVELLICSVIIGCTNCYSVDWHDLLNDGSFANDIEIDHGNVNSNLIVDASKDIIRIGTGNENYIDVTLFQILMCIFCGFIIGLSIGSVLTNCLHCCTSAYRNSFKH